MTTYKIGWHFGWLCVVSEYVSPADPVKETDYWPIERCTESQASPYVGAICVQLAPGAFRARCKGGEVDCGLLAPVQLADYEREFFLVEGSQTKAIHSENVKVPKPKVRAGTELRWKGYWQKYTTKGWVAA